MPQIIPHIKPASTWKRLSAKVGSPPASSLLPPVVKSTLLIELLSLSAKYKDRISALKYPLSQCIYTLRTQVPYDNQSTSVLVLCTQIPTESMDMYAQNTSTL